MGQYYCHVTISARASWRVPKKLKYMLKSKSHSKLHRTQIYIVSNFVKFWFKCWVFGRMFYFKTQRLPSSPPASHTLQSAPDAASLGNPGLWLVERCHVTWILASDWTILMSLPCPSHFLEIISVPPRQYWPLIGQYWSRDLNTGLWLVQTARNSSAVLLITAILLNSPLIVHYDFYDCYNAYDACYNNIHLIKSHSEAGFSPETFKIVMIFVALSGELKVSQCLCVWWHKFV